MPCVVQANVSYNIKRGTLRGMHYQTEPHGETKLVRCTRQRPQAARVAEAQVRQIDQQPLAAGVASRVDTRAERRGAGEIEVADPREDVHAVALALDDAELVRPVGSRPG